MTCTALWLRSASIASVEQKTPRSVRSRFRALLRGLNGARSRYERTVRGTGGDHLEYNYTQIAEDFPGAVRAEALRAAIEQFSALECDPGTTIQAASLAIIESRPAEEQTPKLPFPISPTEISEVPEKALPLTQARSRAIELMLGDAWRKWEGQDIHGVLIARKVDFTEALARDSKLAAQGRAYLVDWRGINADLAHGTRKRDASLKVSFEKLWRWLGWYENGKETKTFKIGPGIAALQDAPSANTGKSKLFGEAPRALHAHDEAATQREIDRLTPAGKRAVELLLADKRSIQMTTEILAREFASLRRLEPRALYSQVWRFQRQLPPSLHLFSKGRAKDFHGRCAPYALRDYTTCRVMQWWVLDHGQDDYFVRNDYIETLDRLAFPELERDEKLRMWLTVFEDIRSRYILGYAFCATPSSDAICSALRMSVLRTGRAPQFGLLDRGKDMKKVAKEKPELSDEAQGAFRRLIEAQWGSAGQVIFSIGEHPQSKPVERWFGTKRERFDSEILSYCGPRPAARPDICEEMLKQHQQFLLGKREHSPLPRASEAIRATAWWIETWYNKQHHHTGHGMGRSTPEEIFQRGYPESERQKALTELDRSKLDEFLRHREPRKVFNGGCVRMFGQEFEPADEKSFGRLLACVGREVLVAADAHKVGDAVAFDPQTGERLGALVCKKLIAWGADKNTIRAKMRHQQSAAKACQKYAMHLQRTESDAFAFLGEERLRATGTDGIRALPPGRPLNLSGSAAAASEVQERGASLVVSDDAQADHARGIWDNANNMPMEEG